MPGLKSRHSISAKCFQYLDTRATDPSLIIFAFPASSVRHPSSRLVSVISKKSVYPIFTKFGMGLYWVNSLHGVAFDEDSCIANGVIAT